MKILKNSFLFILLGISYYNIYSINMSYHKSFLKQYKKPYNIVSYFMLLPKSVLHVDYNERFNLINNLKSKYCCQLQIKELDIKSGYLKLYQPGGDVLDDREIAYWVLKDGTHLVAVYNLQIVTDIVSSDLFFLKFKNFKWKLVENILPKVTYSDIIDKKLLKNLKYKNILSMEVPLIYQLPRKGLNIKATYRYNSLIMQNILERLYKHNPKFSKSEIQKINFNAFGRKHKFDSIEFIWNNGSFIVGRKWKKYK